MSYCCNYLVSPCLLDAVTQIYVSEFKWTVTSEKWVQQYCPGADHGLVLGQVGAGPLVSAGANIGARTKEKPPNSENKHSRHCSSQTMCGVEFNIYRCHKDPLIMLHSTRQKRRYTWRFKKFTFAQQERQSKIPLKQTENICIKTQYFPCKNIFVKV